MFKLSYKIYNFSGCSKSAVEGADTIKQLVEAGKERIIIMAGAGVKSRNVSQLISSTGVKECHASAKTSRYNIGIIIWINF